MFTGHHHKNVHGRDKHAVECATKILAPRGFTGDRLNSFTILCEQLMAGANTKLGMNYQPFEGKTSQIPRQLVSQVDSANPIPIRVPVNEFWSLFVHDNHVDAKFEAQTDNIRRLIESINNRRPVPVLPPAPPVVANADLAPHAPHGVDDEGWEIFEESAYPFRPQ